MTDTEIAQHSLIVSGINKEKSPKEIEDQLDKLSGRLGLADGVDIYVPGNY